MKKRFFLGVVICSVLLVSIFTGCNRPTTPGSMSGRDIVIANVTEIRNLDVHAFQEVVTSRATRHIFSNLVRLRSDMNFHPDLAESWEFLSDTEILFNLRRDVRWHDGTDFKASDVIFSFNRQRQSPAVGFLMDPIRDVIADDDYTIRIILHEPYAPLMANLAHVCSAILPERAVTERGTAFSTNPVGTGSMRFVEMIPGDRLVLERNEDYHGVIALAPRLIFRTIPEEATRSIALETGEIHFDPEVAPPNVARVMAHPNLRLHSWPSIFTEFVMFNTKAPPFDNVLVRQAVAHAIDRETIIQIGVEGHGRSVETVLPPGVLGHTTEYRRFPRDLTQSRELLTRAGFPNGFSTEILVSGDLRTRKAVIVQANLAEVGIRADIRTVEHAALMEAYSTGNYYISLSAWGNGTGDPEGSLFPVFFSGMQGVGGNRAWFECPEVDYWLLRGRATLVENERAHAYAQATKLIMEQVPWVPLYNRIFLIGTHADLRGIDEHPTGYDAYDMLHFP